MTTTAKQIVKSILEELYGRAGFDHYWDSLDKDIQTEIIDELTQIVEIELTN